MSVRPPRLHSRPPALASLAGPARPPSHLSTFPLALAWLLTLALALAQTRAQEPALAHFSTDRPWQIQNLALGTTLAQQRVFDLAFAPDGTTWVAASNGLWHHDGHAWRHYHQAHGLPSSFVRALLWSSTGELWVGTDRGVGVYDPASGRFHTRGTELHLPNQNTRRIAQDPDGTLWFCCDRWPDPSIPPGGLVSLRDGVWTHHDSTRGLPRDAAINYHLTRSGTRLALTTNQWFESTDGRTWTLSPGAALEPIARHVAETPDGRLYVQGENRLLVTDPSAARGWAVLADDTLIVGSTRDHQIFVLRHDTARGLVGFDQWDGKDFHPASSRIADSPDARFHRMAEAPDGSLWCVGNGSVLRWDRSLGPWKHYPSLPRPVAHDTLHRTWFAQDSTILWRENDRFHELRGFGRFHGVDADGAIIGELPDGSLHALPTPHSPTFPTTGLRPPGPIRLVCPDHTGRLWLIGHAPTTHTTFALHRGPSGWVLAQTADQDAPEFSSAQAAAEGGIRFITVNRDTKAYHLLHATPDGSLLPVDLGADTPALTFPHHVRIGDHDFLHAYLGLYQSQPAPDTPWKRSPVLGDALVHDFSATEDSAVWLFQNRQTGSRQAALFTASRWHLIDQAYDNVLPATSNRGFVFTRRGEAYVQLAPHTLDFALIPLPEPQPLHQHLTDHAGTRWFGTPEGVLRRDPGRDPPRTRIHAPVTQIRLDQTLPLVFSATTRFQPHLPPNAYRYSWRIDQGPWRELGHDTQLDLAVSNLAPGPHHLHVRATDADELPDPLGATLLFHVARIPLQERAFFPYLVGALLLIITTLAWLGLNRARVALHANRALLREIEEHQQTETELHATNEQLVFAQADLERRVAERTAELTEANSALRAALEAREAAALRQAALEQQLREAQKLEAIGTLAGGIAHDINNILTVIIPCASFARQASPPDSPARDYLDQILKAADRAKNLVKQVLTFSRRRKAERQVVHLPPLIEETTGLLRSALPASTHLATRIAPHPAPVFADPHQLHQVLMNLCTNAHQALPDHRGSIVIHLENLTLSATPPADAPALPPGDYVRLAVEDDGKGVPLELQNRIFEPFFTTKGPGEGTGLGLAVVHGIIQAHEGLIRFRPRPEGGSRFEIFLPAAATPPAPASLSPFPLPPSPAGPGHILAVDDETGVLNLVALALRQRGFTVDAFSDPARALAAFRAQPKQYHLVITDLNMPQITGVELAGELLRIRPTLPILLITGVEDNAAITSARAAGIARLLPKPFLPGELYDAVNDLLAADRA